VRAEPEIARGRIRGYFEMDWWRYGVECCEAKGQQSEALGEQMQEEAAQELVPR